MLLAKARSAFMTKVQVCSCYNVTILFVCPLSTRIGYTSVICPSKNQFFYDGTSVHKDQYTHRKHNTHDPFCLWRNRISQWNKILNFFDNIFGKSNNELSILLKVRSIHFYPLLFIRFVRPRHPNICCGFVKFV